MIQEKQLDADIKLQKMRHKSLDGDYIHNTGDSLEKDRYASQCHCHRWRFLKLLQH